MNQYIINWARIRNLSILSLCFLAYNILGIPLMILLVYLDYDLYRLGYIVWVIVGWEYILKPLIKQLWRFIIEK